LTDELAAQGNLGGDGDMRRSIVPGLSRPAEACAPLAERVLRANWTVGERDGVPYSYTRPSPRRYPWQWYWDSCFTAIAWRRFDARRARAELETLLRGGRQDGFVGHTIFWHRPVSLVRRGFYNVRDRSSPATETIQPPMLAWAWRIAVGDPADEPGIERHHAWLGANRDLDGDGLLWIVQPDESGLDSSPKFDPAWGRRAHGRPGFVLLVRRNRGLGWDARAILAAGGPLLCEVVVNVLWCLSRLAVGQPSITPAIVARLYDERRGLFLDEARPSGLRPSIETWAALAPLALPDLPDEIGRRLVEEHLLDPRRFWLPFPPPSVAATEPSFQSDRSVGVLRRYWRGPTWVNAAWLVWIGLRRLGYGERAAELARALRDSVLREGLREYYHPTTGRGLGAREFSWSSLVVEMTDPDPAVERSYLPGAPALRSRPPAP
jgi:Glycosyl hydrolase family 63 C-terminal domain